MDNDTTQLVQKMVAELEDVKHIHKWDAVDVIRYVAHKMECFGDNFMQNIFAECGLKQSDCLYALVDLKGTLGELEDEPRGGYVATFMPRPVKERYRSRLDEQLAKEPEPEKVQVSKTLLDLESEIGDSNERLFYAETRLCLQAKAYRAAIVMGWNLAYEHVIGWVFSDTGRLQTFNDELTTRWINKKKNTKYDPICDRGDFGNVKESIVVDVCRKSNLIGKNDFDLLDGALRRRNTFAHPNSSQTADGPIASGHVSELVRRRTRLSGQRIGWFKV